MKNSLKVVSKKLLFSSGETEWVLAQKFDPHPDTKNTRGEMYVVIGAKSNGQSIELISKERELVALLHDSYYGNTALTAFNAISEAVKSVRIKAGIDAIDVSISAVCHLSDVIYVSAVGGGSVSIFRNGSVSKILASTQDTVAASGYPEENDVLVLTTPSFEHNFPENTLRSFLMDAKDKSGFVDLSDVVTKIKTEAHGDVNSGVYFVEFVDEGNVSKNVYNKPVQAIDTFVDTREPSIAGEPDIGSPVFGVSGGDVGGNIVSEKSPLWSRLMPAGLGRRANKVGDSRSISIGSEESLETSKKKRLTLSVGIIIIIILFVSIGFGINQKNMKETKMLFEPRLEQAQHDYEEALGLFGLSPDRAREHFYKSQSTIEALVAEGVEDERVATLASDLATNRGRILGEYILESQSFIDLSLLSDGFAGDDVAMSDETIYILDREGRKLVSVNTSTKRSEVLAGPGAIEEDPFYVSTSADRAYVSSADGIYRVDEGKDRSIEEDMNFAKLPYSYAGSLYVVDITGSKIKRYSAYEGGFAEGADWLVDGAKPDLSKIKSISIDGVIWMVSETGGVYKFSLGNQVNYNVGGLFPEISSPTQIYTNEELEHLYILEPLQNRVVVLDKEGVFIAQYISQRLGAAIDLGVSKAEKKIIFLTGEKLESIDLGHL